MTEEGVIKGYRAILDEDLLGWTVGFIMINVKPGSMSRVVDGLLGDDRVLEIYEVHGPTDLIAKARAKTTNALGDVTKWVRTISDVTSTQVVTSFKTWRRL